MFGFRGAFSWRTPSRERQAAAFVSARARAQLVINSVGWHVDCKHKKLRKMSPPVLSTFCVRRSFVLLTSVSENSSVTLKKNKKHKNEKFGLCWIPQLIRIPCIGMLLHVHAHAHLQILARQSWPSVFSAVLEHLRKWFHFLLFSCVAHKVRRVCTIFCL